MISADKTIGLLRTFLEDLSTCIVTPPELKGNWDELTTGDDVELLDGDRVFSITPVLDTGLTDFKQGRCELLPVKWDGAKFENYTHFLNYLHKHFYVVVGEREYYHRRNEIYIKDGSLEQMIQLNR